MACHDFSINALSYFQLKLLYLFLAGHSLDHSAEAPQFLFKPLITSLDIDNIVNDRDEIGRASCRERV